MSFIKKLTSTLVAASLVLGLVGTAFAAPTAGETNAAFDRLSTYKIVQGVAGPTGEVTPALDQAITRAQLLAILVRAWGQESNAKLLQGATTGFADVDGNAAVAWTTGYIFIGSRIAETNGGPKLGMGANFVPSGNLTAAETLAFVMKFLGLQAGTGANWVADTIAAAKTAGLITDADEAKYLANPTAQVNRGEAFAMLDSMFAGYNKLEGGKTIYTTFIDNKAPELTVNKPELTTDKTALTITGQVKDYTTLYLGSEAITANADGTFSVEVKLAMGKNDISISALDKVGNSAEESFTVTRNPGTAAKLVATIPSANVVAGAAVDVTVKVLDANDVELEVVAADITATIGGSVGTYADGKFTAAEKVGTGTLSISYGDLTPVTIDVTVVAGPLAKVNASATSVEKGGTIKLTPTDKFGNDVATGVEYTWAGASETSKEDGIAVTKGGIVYTSAPGLYVVTAKAGEAEATATIGVFSSTVAGYKFSAPAEIVANGTTAVKVTASPVDEFGNVITSSTATFNVTGVGLTFAATETGSYSAGPFTVTPDKGVATFYVKASTALGGETVTIFAAKGAATESKTTLAGQIPVAKTLKVTAPKYLAANKANSDSITVKVVDQADAPVQGLYTVKAAITGPAKLVNATSTYVNGTAASFSINNAESIGSEGTIAVTFTVEGIGTATANVQHVIAGNPAKLALTSDKDTLAAASGATFTFTVEAQDRNGVPVALYQTETVTITLPDDYKASFTVPGSVNITAGAKSATFTAVVIGKHTGNVDVSVKAAVTPESGSDIEVTGSKTVAVTNGEVSTVTLDRSGTVYASVSEPKTTFVASVADLFGNAVAKADVELSVYATGIAGVTVNDKTATSSAPITVKTDAAGKVNLQLAARPYSSETYNLVVKYGSNEATVAMKVENRVVANVATRILKEITAGNFIEVANVTAGEAFYVVAAVKDNYGGAYNFGASGSLKLTAPEKTVALPGSPTTLLDATGVAAVTLADTGAPAGLTLGTGEYFVKLIAGKAGVLSVGTKYAALQNAVSATSNVAVKAGTLANLSVNEKIGKSDASVTNIEVTGAGEVKGSYTMSLVDAYGNIAPQTVNTKVTIDAISKNGTPGAESKLSFRAETGGATKVAFDTQSTTSFYFVATETGKYAVTASVKIDLNGDGDYTDTVNGQNETTTVYFVIDVK